MFLFGKNSLRRLSTLNDKDMNMNKRKERKNDASDDEGSSESPHFHHHHYGGGKTGRNSRQVVLSECNIKKELDDHAISELKACFDSFDVIGKQNIMLHQVKLAFESFNITVDEEECKEIIAAFDLTGTGTITWRDFQREMYDIMGSGTDETHIKMVFNMMDKDGDGSIGALEISEQFKKFGIIISEEEAMESMSKIDLKGNGFIDYPMFVDFCNRTDMVQVLGKESLHRMKESKNALTSEH